MKQRQLGKSGILVSEVGLGCEHLQGQSAEAIAAVIDTALENGVNLFDTFMSEPQVRSDIGAALRGRREKAVLQGHIGAAWLDGQYCRTREPEHYRRFFEDYMERIGTDYVDIGMLHFVDTQSDFESVFHTEMIRYATELKEQGVIRAVGMSSHDPAAALKAVRTGLIDVLMFSLNPAFDLLPAEATIDDLFEPETFRREGFSGMDPVREELFRTCETMGVGITVMKPLGAGALLSDAASPFGKALTPVQCIHYALTRPAVASALVGCRTPEEVLAAAAYETAGDGERDYSAVLGGSARYSIRGKCMYCNHCLPCPSHIDIAQVNKYLDLASLSEQIPPTVREHYHALNAHGGDCVGCRSCEENCPFSVPVVERMAKAREVFGE